MKHIINKHFQYHRLFILLCFLAVSTISCKKKSPNNNTNNPENPTPKTKITETITNFSLNNNTIVGHIKWLGKTGIYLYGYTANRIYKINTENKQIEKVFDINFDFYLNTGSLIFTMGNDGYLYFSAQCSYTDPEIPVGKMSVEGAVSWIKRVKVTLGTNYYSYHLDPQSIHVFDNAVWVAGSKTLVKLNAQTGALEAAKQLPFHASDYAVPTAVVPVGGDRIAISFRNAINHLTLLYCKRSDLSFTEMVTNKMTSTINGLTTWSITGNVFPIGDDKLLYLSKYTRTGQSFFPVSYAVLFDLKGNAIKSKILNRNDLDLIDISTAHIGENGRYYVTLRNTASINDKINIFNILSTDNDLNFVKSKGLNYKVAEAGRMVADFSAPFAYKGNNVVTHNGKNQLYWIDYTNVGCHQDNYIEYNANTIDLPFGTPSSTTTISSYMGLTFSAPVNGNATLTDRSITQQTKEECTKDN